MSSIMDKLVGRTIGEIRMDENCLAFDTDEGLVVYQVVGDCCSYSYFHDFFGVKNLLANGPVIRTESIDERDIPNMDKIVDKHENGGYGDDCIQVYGFRLTTMHPLWGEVSSVVSFRNLSNGYYGGWMEEISSQAPIQNVPVLEDDFYGD